MKSYLLPVVLVRFNQYLCTVNNSVGSLPHCKAPGLNFACIIEGIYANLIVLQLAGFVALSLTNKQTTRGEGNTNRSLPQACTPVCRALVIPRKQLLKAVREVSRFQAMQSGTLPNSYKTELWGKLSTLHYLRFKQRLECQQLGAKLPFLALSLVDIEMITVKLFTTKSSLLCLLCSPCL